MTAFHSTPAGTAIRLQSWVLWKSGRVALLWAVIVGILLLLELLAQIGLVFVPAVPKPSSWPRLFGAFDFLGIAGFGWGVALWAGESPSKRDLHWSMPISRVTHDVCRVVAGWAYLILGVAVLCGAGLLLAYRSGGWHHITGAGPGVWTAFILQATLPFSTGAAVGLAFDRASRAAVLGALCFMALRLLERSADGAVRPTSIVAGSMGLFGVAKSALRVRFDPAYHPSVPWWCVSLVWLIALALIVPASSQWGYRRRQK